MSKITSRETNEFIEQKLSSQFFLNNMPGPMSPYNILHHIMLDDTLNQRIYTALPREKKNELLAENKMIDDETDTEKLYNMLRKSFNPTGVNILVNKLIQNEENIVPRLFQDIKRSGNDNFVEGAAKILVKCKNNYSKELVEILPQIKYPYTQAVMGFVLGKIGGEEHIETIYNLYMSLGKDYPMETYYEGPLLGLHEIRVRYEF